MTARIDHAEKAQEWAEKASNPDARKTLTYSSLAQMHATLALVEQQRIANMQTECRDLRARAAGRHDTFARTMLADADALEERIREGLGL